MPLPPEPVISQSVMRTSRPPRTWISPRRVGSGMPPPSKVMPERPIASAPSLWIADGPPVKTNFVAPRTPISCVPFGSRSNPLR